MSCHVHCLSANKCMTNGRNGWRVVPNLDLKTTRRLNLWHKQRHIGSHVSGGGPSTIVSTLQQPSLPRRETQKQNTSATKPLQAGRLHRLGGYLQSRAPRAWLQTFWNGDYAVVQTARTSDLRRIVW